MCTVNKMFMPFRSHCFILALLKLNTTEHSSTCVLILRVADFVPRWTGRHFFICVPTLWLPLLLPEQVQRLAPSLPFCCKTRGTEMRQELCVPLVSQQGWLFCSVPNSHCVPYWKHFNFLITKRTHWWQQFLWHLYSMSWVDKTASLVYWSGFLTADPEGRVWFPALPDFLRSSGTGTGSTQPPEYNWRATWKKKQRFRSKKNREYGRRDPPRWPRKTSLSAKVGTTFTDKRRCCYCCDIIMEMYTCV
jgi:hypothetical protein